VIQYIQILGLQCSGTNALARLIEANTDIPVGLKYGGKHGQGLKWDAIESSKDVLFVYVQKDIAAWVVSMRNRPHGCFPEGLSLGQAMKCRWSNLGESFGNILRMRAEMLSRYKRIQSAVGANWRGIDSRELIRDPELVLNFLLHGRKVQESVHYSRGVAPSG
jgi:hypothetical protein